MKEHIAECINILGKFCGKRDISELTAEQIYNRYGVNQVDIMVLFGGSIICGGDVLARAMQNNIAKNYIIVGGEGHTTETLRQRVHKDYPQIETDGLSEAQIFESYLEYRYGLQADYLECKSTNCGNNITYLLDLIKEKQIPFTSIILAQDATMQHRMEAGLRKFVKDIEIINFATYEANVVVKNAELSLEREIYGMWDLERYITLLMGEIPRLTDDPEGYGPKGKGFIAHVEIPLAVRNAFLELRQEYTDSIREANPLYASDRG